MKRSRSISQAFCLILVAASLHAVGQVAPTSFHTSTACADLPHADHPKAALSNGTLDAVLFLPDPVNGYYRSSRFDWAGVIGCVSYKGHTFFGEWFPTYDPMLHDAITGPVEEFRGIDGEIGYDRADARRSFLKIGVGVLRRIDASPYKFASVYPVLDTGTRKVHISKRSITFTQRLTTDFSYAYLYTKTVKLDKHGAVLTIEHKLKNIGSATIASEVYEHDFFMLDNKTAGPGIVIKLGFTPVIKNLYQTPSRSQETISSTPRRRTVITVPRDISPATPESPGSTASRSKTRPLISRWNKPLPLLSRRCSSGLLRRRYVPKLISTSTCLRERLRHGRSPTTSKLTRYGHNGRVRQKAQ